MSDTPFDSFQDAASAVVMDAPAPDPVVAETPAPVVTDTPVAEPVVNTDQPTLTETPKVETPPVDDFYVKFGEKLGNNEIKDEASFTKWREESSKPKEPEYPHELAKQQIEYLKGAKDEAEVRSRLREFNFYTLTDWEAMTKTDEGMNQILKIGHQLENPGMSQRALDYDFNKFIADHPTDVEELKEAGEPDPEGRAEFNKAKLIQKAQGTLDKIYAKKGSLQSAVQQASDPVGEARKSYTENAKSHLSSFKLGTGDLEYAMAEKDVAELSTAEAYNAFTQKLSDPVFMAKIMAAQKFLDGGGLDAMIKKAQDKGHGNVLNKMSNTAAPNTAEIPNSGTVVAGNYQEAARSVVR